MKSDVLLKVYVISKDATVLQITECEDYSLIREVLSKGTKTLFVLKTHLLSICIKTKTKIQPKHYFYKNIDWIEHPATD